MTAARALIHADGYAMWWDGILHNAGEMFTYRRFVRNELVLRSIPTDDRNVIRIEAEP